MKRSKNDRPHFWITIPVLTVLGLCIWIFVVYPKEPVISLPVYPRGNHSIFDTWVASSHLYLDQNGLLWFEDARVNESEFSKQLDVLKREYGQNIPFNIHADENLAFSEIWNLIEILKAKGFWKLNLIFQKPNSNGTFPLEFYAPKFKGCSECSDSPVIFDGGGLIIDLNVRTGRIDSGENISWESLPRIITRLWDFDPTKPVTLIVNPRQKYGEVVKEFSYLSIANQPVALLPAHHGFNKTPSN